MKSQFPKKEDKQNITLWIFAIVVMVITVTLVVVFFVGLHFMNQEKEEEEIPTVIAEPIKTEAQLVIEKVEKKSYAEPEITDRDIMAMVVMAESGSEKFIGKVAVAATILNRASEWDMTIKEVVEMQGQYSYPYYGAVSHSCYEAVDYAMENRDMFPKNMLYFRNKHYHTFGNPYIQIGHHYFSTDGEPEFEIEGLGKND